MSVSPVGYGCVYPSCPLFCWSDGSFSQILVSGWIHHTLPSLSSCHWSLLNLSTAQPAAGNSLVQWHGFTTHLYSLSTTSKGSVIVVVVLPYTNYPLKQHTFIISQFSWVGNLGMVSMSPLPRISQGCNQGVCPGCGLTWNLGSSFKITWLLNKFISLKPSN